MEIKEQAKKEQTIKLVNRQDLSISGVTRIISLKPELIQLDSVFGGIIITGENLELLNLNNQNTLAEIKGKINLIKFVEGKNKEPFFRKIFKWFLLHKINLIHF